MKKLMQSKYFKWGVTGFATIAFGICFYYIIFMSRNISAAFDTILMIVMPIIYGLALAYIFSPILNWIERKILFPICHHNKIDMEKEKIKRRVRSISIVLTLLFVVLVIYAFFALVIPQLVRSIQSIIFQFPIYVNNLVVLVQNALIKNPEVEKYATDFLNAYSTDVNSWLNESILPRINTIVKSVSLSIISILKAFYNLIIGFIISIYVLSNKEHFAAQAKKMAYALWEKHTANLVVNNFRFINRTFIGFFGGKILDSAIIGIICFAGCYAAKMPYSVLVSVIIGVTNIIPFFGPYIGAIPSTLLILMVDPVKSLWFLLGILVLQQIDGNFIGPKILGDSTGLSGFWVIFSITFFGGLWGIMGMIVGVPIFAVVYAAISSVIDYMLRQKDLPAKTEDYIKLDHIDDEETFVYMEDTPKSSGKKHPIPKFSLVNIKKRAPLESSSEDSSADNATDNPIKQESTDK